MLPTTSLLVLFSLLTKGNSFVVDSKVELPAPSGMDSSLSPNLVRAFYEITFAPAKNEGLKNKLGEASIQATDKGCQYSKEFCKFFHFTPTKVLAVQEADDLIRRALVAGEVPVVEGYGASDAQVSEILNEVNKRVNKVVPVKGKPNNTTSLEGEVPVYKGVVNTQTVLDRDERPQFSYRPPVYFQGPPARPYYPPRRSPYNDWRT